jgi:hypothetical protein
VAERLVEAMRHENFRSPAKLLLDAPQTVGRQDHCLFFNVPN